MKPKTLGDSERLMSSPRSAKSLATRMFGAVIAALMAGYPVVFTLAGVGFAFGLIGNLFGDFDLSYPSTRCRCVTGASSTTRSPDRSSSVRSICGKMLERSGISRGFCRTLERAFGRLHGGLAFAVIVGGVAAGGL